MGVDPRLFPGQLSPLDQIFHQGVVPGNPADLAPGNVIGPAVPLVENSGLPLPGQHRHQSGAHSGTVRIRAGPVVHRPVGLDSGLLQPFPVLRGILRVQEGL